MHSEQITAEHITEHPVEQLTEQFIEQPAEQSIEQSTAEQITISSTTILEPSSTDQQIGPTTTVEGLLEARLQLLKTRVMVMELALIP